MPALLLVFGALSGCFFAMLVGIIGSNRRIGFGWSFLLSLIFTPLIGLIITLFSEPLPYSADRRWGCLAVIFGLLGFLLFIPILLAIMGLSLAAFI